MFASCSLKGTEKNYHVTDLESLTLEWALRKWYTLLMGRRVRVYIDYRALSYLSTCVRHSSRIARWWTFLQEFELEIKHIPGKNNMMADQLSRQQNGREEMVTKQVELIKNKNEGTDIVEWIRIIRQDQDQDKEL